jgi:hypothetical protein
MLASGERRRKRGVVAAAGGTCRASAAKGVAKAMHPRLAARLRADEVVAEIPRGRGLAPLRLTGKAEGDVMAGTVTDLPGATWRAVRVEARQR